MRVRTVCIMQLMSRSAISGRCSRLPSKLISAVSAVISQRKGSQRLSRLMRPRTGMSYGCCPRWCPCARSKRSAESCFRPFAIDEPRKSELIRMRWKLCNLHKHDADEKAMGEHKQFFCIKSSGQMASMLKDVPDGDSAGRRSLVLLGQPICQVAWRKLLGCGSQRFRRLRRCGLKGVKPPQDLRFLAKRGSHFDAKKRAKRAAVVEFLTQLYEKVSEPMPETCGPQRGARKMAFQRRRGRRPREALRLHRGKVTAGVPGLYKLLPPGTFTDYHKMFSADSKEPVSLKLFTKAPRCP